MEPGLSLGWASLLFFGLALIYFFPAFLPGRHIFGTDYLAAGVFFQDFIEERFAVGEIPRWVPFLYGGVPFFANPASLFYPPRLMADALFPVERIFPTLFVIQFGLAGVGMYLLAAELRCRRWVAVVAGLAFQFTGITMSWVYAGQDGRIIVATLTPLLFFFLHRGIRTAALPWFAGAAATTGFALLSFQIQSAYYMLLAGACWAIFVLIHRGIYRRGTLLAKTVALGLAAVAFGFALAAVNFLPFMDYVAESPRGQEGGRGYEYSTSYSMPEAEILSLAVPEQAGVSVSDPMDGTPFFRQYRGENPFKLHTEYVGAFVLVLVALGGYLSRRDKYWWFFLGLGVFFLTIALGGNTPLYQLYYEILPGTKRFRAPSICFFVVSLALVSMAALTLERLAGLVEEARRGARGGGEAGGELDRVVWIAGGVAGIGILGAMLNAGGEPTAPGVLSAAQGWTRFAFFSALVTGAIWLWTRGRISPRVAALLLGAVTLLDLWVIARPFFHTVPPPEEMFAPDDVVRFLEGQPGPFRAWVLPFPGGAVYRGHTDYLMYYDIDQAGGEHGNQLQRYNEFVGAGTQTYVDWHNFLEHPVFLDAANVRYIISGVELNTSSLREVHRGSAIVYENPHALPRAYLVPEVRTVTAPDGALDVLKEPGFDPRRTAVVYGTDPGLPVGPLAGDAQIVSATPEQVVVRTRADRAALLVLSDNFHKDWVARIDGRELPILQANHTFRGVSVPAGEQVVTFSFEPRELYTGLMIYLAGFGILCLYGIFLLVRWWRGRDQGALVG